jgi:hypothetical protein
MDKYNGSVPHSKALSGFGIVALIACFAIPATASEATLLRYSEQNGTVRVSVAAPVSGGVGWQAPYNFAIPQGRNLLFSYKCPDTAKTPVGNSFSPTTATKVGLELVGSLLPLHATQEWDWAINWPSGAPANSHIYFNVYCVQ